MQARRENSILAIFQPDSAEPQRAFLVAGACGNVGFGKLGQLARLLAPRGIPVIALDPSPALGQVLDKLREAFASRFSTAEVDAIVSGIHLAKSIAELPADLRLGFVLEAVPERLALKHELYRQIRARDPEAYIFSATSGFPSQTLFADLPGSDRCGVIHPFFPHLTNKLWELAERDATTSLDQLTKVKRMLADLGMNLIPVRDVPAFAADRIFCGMMLEAVRIHADLGLTPGQIDDACKRLLGTSPFYVHNLIPGANYLSAHCMQLMQQEVDSTLFAIPPVWQPYLDDPKKQWPYERGEKCPPERFREVEQRMLGMMFALTAGMLGREVVALDALNYLCENALAFREGVPATMQKLGLGRARDILQAFLREQKITKAEEVAPLQPLQDEAPGWNSIYVDTQVQGEVGLLSLKRSAINDVFIDELDRGYEILAGDGRVKAIVLAPDGSFSRETGHGADLACFVPVLGKKPAALALIRRWKATLLKLRGGKPTVCALVGRVLGGSLELAANCHARIAAEGTRLAFPETTVGVIPGLGGCHHLHRFCGPEHDREINLALLTGKTVSAEDAERWGFVQKVVPVRSLAKTTLEYAHGLGHGSEVVPTFHEGPRPVEVDEGNIPGRNEAGVALDSQLRELLVRTIVDANNSDWASASAIEEERAADSLCLSSSKIGVAALQRGKPPQFEHPLP